MAAYGTSESPLGPFEYRGKILENNPEVAQGAGHHSAMLLPNTEDDWIVCYHRRPLDASAIHHRVSCLDKMEFREDGTIAPVTLTFEGIAAHRTE